MQLCQRSFHGQVRYWVQIWRGEGEDEYRITPTIASRHGGTSVNRIFKALEEAMDALGLEYYSVSQTTLSVLLLVPLISCSSKLDYRASLLTTAGSANVVEEVHEVKKWFRFWNQS